jgi:hypothetical protein
MHEQLWRCLLDVYKKYSDMFADSGTLLKIVKIFWPRLGSESWSYFSINARDLGSDSTTDCFSASSPMRSFSHWQSFLMQVDPLWIANVRVICCRDLQLSLQRGGIIAKPESIHSPGNYMLTMKNIGPIFSGKPQMQRR